MRPVKLTMSAFGPYSQVEVIDFEELRERNLFLITGPTGSGKTTIFDAISYALYGKASGDLRTEDTLRSHFSEVDVLTEVKLTFELKGLTYHVHRVPKQMRPKTKSEGFTEQKPEANLTIEDGEPRTVIAGVSKVNKKLEEILGINEDQFKQIMMIPQGEFRKLLTSDSQEREKVLQQLFDTYIYRRIQGELNEQAKSLGSEIKSKKVERDTLVTKIKCGEDDILEQMILSDDKFIDGIVQHTNDLLKTDREVVGTLLAALKKLDKGIESVLKEQSKALEDNKNLKLRETFTEELNEQVLLSQSMAEQQEQITLAEKAARLIGTEDNILSREKALVIKEEDQRSTESKIKQLAETLAEAKKSLDQEKAPEAEATRNKLRLQLGNYKSHVDKVKSLESLTKEIQTTEARHKDLKDNIRDKNEQVKTLNNQQNEDQKEMESLKDVAVMTEKAKNRYDKESLNRGQMKKVIKQLNTLLLMEESKQKKVEAVETTLKVHEACNKAYKEGKYTFLTNQAAFLAKELKIGEACPVCGSLEHPIPAQMPEEAVTEDDLDMLEEKLNTADRKFRKAEEALAVQEERYTSNVKISEELIIEVYGASAEAMLGKQLPEQSEEINRSIQVIEETLGTIEAEMNQLSQKRKRYEVVVQAIAKAKQGIEEITGQLKELDQQFIELVALLTTKKTNLTHIFDEVPEGMRQLEALTQLIQATEKEIQGAENQLKAAREAYDTVNSHHIETSSKNTQLIKAIGEDQGILKELKASFNQQMKGAGFADQESYTSSKLAEAQIVAMKEAQVNYHRHLDRLKASVKELSEKTEGMEVTDMEQYDLRLKTQQNERNSITDEQGVVKNRISDNEATIKRVTSINDQIKDKETKYNVVGKLARIAQGNNPAMMTFERYVLAAFLEDILKAANIRLRQMTQGRYILSRTSELQRKNKQSGLELEVFDNFTGKSRHVKTLSGGEGFKASLSMALGLSDVVQSYAGGVRLDTMFIDEGFGTLDQESLDSAINCLIDLQKTGRLVGIISHVQELKERIDTRLEIMSTNKGSESRFVLG